MSIHTHKRQPIETPASAPIGGARHWLLLVHQLPTSPSNLRVRTWRRLQQIGAIPIKQAVYVLPDSAESREDFAWLKAEIESARGQATVFAADTVDGWAEERLIEAFRRSAEDAYRALAKDIEQALRRIDAPRRTRGRRASSASRLQDIFQQRLAAIERADFFGSAGRDRAIVLVQQLAKLVTARNDSAAQEDGGATRAADYKGRLWVTRPRPGVDRMASAWLIARFIDPAARFAFVPERQPMASDALPFDMFGVPFSHQGDRCTFETLCDVFELDDSALRRLAAIVHDLDFKDGRFHATEAPAVEALISGLRLAHADDDVLLNHGMTMFDALYRAFEQSMRTRGPRAVARKRTRDVNPSRKVRTSVKHS
jgi:hypothetical protein